MPPPANVTYNTASVASYGLGPEPGDWDIHAKGAAGWDLSLQQVLAQLWPSAFYSAPSGAQVLDTSLLVSATEESSRPQTVVYQINPRAVWSDGAPLTYVDFVYNWQAQSGQARFKDVGGVPYDPANEAGYDDIADVTGSPADPYTATVTFSAPYPDWRSLFSYLMPAHIAQVIGFSSGFTDPVADLVSAGPYIVSQVHPGYSLQLVRNARYWGTPGNLAVVTYYFTSTLAETLNALSGHELDVAIVPASPGAYQQLQAAGGLSVRGVASSSYEDLDFNQSSPSAPDAVLRQAVMLALDRTTLAADVLGPYGMAASPVENRIYLPGEAGYRADGTGYGNPAPTAALALLAANGYTFTNGTLDRPDGRPVDLSLFVPSADPVAQQLAPLIVASCAAIGVTVTLDAGGPAAAALGVGNAWAGGLWPGSVGAGSGWAGPGPFAAGAGTPGTPGSPEAGGAGALRPPPGWQMALELRQVPATPSSIAGLYATDGADNLDGYSSATMDALFGQVATAAPAQLPGLYDEVDNQAWADFVDVPLVQVPVLVVVGPGLLNVRAGPYFGDLAWDEQVWGFRSP
jgi:ABC-type transport system substrate-binding protein